MGETLTASKRGSHEPIAPPPRRVTALEKIFEPKDLAAPDYLPQTVPDSAHAWSWSYRSVAGDPPESGNRPTREEVEELQARIDEVLMGVPEIDDTHKLNPDELAFAGHMAVDKS